MNVFVGADAASIKVAHSYFLVADREGSVVAFALGNLQERAQMFVEPGDQVYEGMLAAGRSMSGSVIKGIDPKLAPTVLDVGPSMRS